MKTILLFLGIFAFSSHTFGQLGSVEWQHTYGGAKDDVATSIMQLPDGGFLVIGTTESKGAGKKDYYLIKLNATGKVIWEKTLGGSKNDIPASIMLTDDGNYLLSGSTSSKGKGGYDYWLMKIAKNGKPIWDKTYGGTKSDELKMLIKTNDTNYFACGYSKSRGNGGHDCFLIRINKEGKRLWRKAYGAGGRDVAECIIQRPDSAYVFCGYTTSQSTGMYDFWIAKISYEGKMEWEKKYGDKGMESARAITQAEDKGYIVCGYVSTEKEPNFNIWIIKLDYQGKKVWERIYGEKKGEQPNSMIKEDGGYIICGYTSSSGEGKKDAWIFKIDEKGKILWEETYGDIENEEAMSIIPTADGGYAVCGYSDSEGEGKKDFWVMKFKGEK